MNNGIGSLFLKACHKASAFSGILLEHEKLCRSLTKGGTGGGGGSFWDPAASWEGNVLWSKGRNVAAVVRVKWELFWNGKGCRWKCRRWAWTLGGGRNHEESWDKGWQLRHTNALSVFGFSLSVSRDAACLQMWDESRVQTRTDEAEDFINQ